MRGGIEEMPGTQFEATKQRRRGSPYAADMAAYLRQIGGDNSAKISALKAALAEAIQEDLTPRQREIILAYYNEGLTQRQIAARLGIERSTVSRTKRRGEARLRKCLRVLANIRLEDEDFN